MSELEGDYTLITGGAGFIGANLAHRLCTQGRNVVLYDNLQRSGVEINAHWLRSAFGERVQLVRGDIRDATELRRWVRGAQAVYHFAAQVAVTTSLVDPLDDHAVNTLGTLNVLEALRGMERQVPLLFTSTNKVYGALDDIELREQDGRYMPAAESVNQNGIGEWRALDFHSPYGCSKGAAEQYVLDYARSYGLRTMVFRMSCVYGPRQFGTEDQGWVAHFLIRAASGAPITIYGDGKQVRDVLFVSDLLDAMQLAERNSERLHGRAFNIGGGPANVLSLLELVERIGGLQGRTPVLRFEAPRVGDQRYYVSDTRSFEAATGWRARVSVAQGLQELSDWLARPREASEHAPPEARANQ